METTAICRPVPFARLLAVQASDGRWLAPCAPARARQLLRTGRARMVWQDAKPHLQLLSADMPSLKPAERPMARPAMSGGAA